MTTFLDTNVLVSLINNQEPYHKWCLEEFIKHKERGPVGIADIVYCEFSVAMVNRSDVDAVVAELGLERMQGNDDALFSAGKAYKKYKDVNGGPKLNVLPDFIIGAIADELRVPLITNNARDFRGYFPNIQLICPP